MDTKITGNKSMITEEGTLKKILSTKLLLFIAPLLIVSNIQAQTIEQTSLENIKNKASATFKVNQPPTTRIVGGKEVVSNSYPFMAAVISAGESVFLSHNCGASLVSPTLVLTAAHCLTSFPNTEDLEVFIGQTDLSKEAEGRRVKLKDILVSKTFFHKKIEFDYLGENSADSMAVIRGYGDIALLELAEAVDDITPVKILSAEMFNTLTAGTNLTVMGWGNRDSSGDEANSDFPLTLHEVDIPLYSNEQCLNEYQEIFGATHEFQGLSFCAGFSEGGKDACQGDSGGPIVYRHNNELFQVGVVSGGAGCAQENAPGIYATVHQYENIEQLYASLVPLSIYKEVKDELEITRTIINSDYDNELLSLTYLVNNLTNKNIFIESITAQTPLTNVSNNTCQAQTVLANQSCNFTVTVDFKSLEIVETAVSIVSKHEQLTEPLIKSVGGIQFLLSNQQETLADTLKNPITMQWFSSDNGEWLVSTEDNESIISSADINDGQFSAIMAKFSGERVNSLSFEYQVSSEADFDFLLIVHNGQIIEVDSGEMTEFKLFEITEFTSSENQLVFNYIKDNELSEGNDNVKIKNITLGFNNQAPTLIFKEEGLIVNELTSFTLDASTSTDADNDELSFSWQQVSGPNITITTPNEAVLTLTAPSIDKDESIVIKAIATDKFGGRSEKSITVQVSNINANKVDNKATSNSSSGGTSNTMLIMLLIALFSYRQNRVIK